MEIEIEQILQQLRETQEELGAVRKKYKVLKSRLSAYESHGAVPVWGDVDEVDSRLKVLIVAIPKSASTSLARTLAKSHNVRHITGGTGFSPWNKNAPKDFKLLAEIHPSVRSFDRTKCAPMQLYPGVYHYHIPPTFKNLKLFKAHPKVIVLRKPESIPASYFREAQLGYREVPEIFRGCENLKMWVERAAEVGLLHELEAFYQGWVKAEGNQLIIHYEELVDNPARAIETIEDYLEVSRSKVQSLLKARYSFNRRDIDKIFQSGISLDAWTLRNGVKSTSTRNFLLTEVAELTKKKSTLGLDLDEYLFLARGLVLLGLSNNSIEIYRSILENQREFLPERLKNEVVDLETHQSAKVAKFLRDKIGDNPGA